MIYRPMWYGLIGTYTPQSHGKNNPILWYLIVFSATVEPLNLDCQAEFLSDSQQVNISCSSSRNLSSLQFECSLDGVSVTTGCELLP